MKRFATDFQKYATFEGSGNLEGLKEEDPS